jgi:hypothetical protein
MSMSEYTPDKWVVIELDYEGVKTQKILSSWYGGWAGSDSWRLSSGITGVEELEDLYIIKNESGSVYTCYKGSYGMSAYASGVLEDFKKQALVTIVEKYESKD